MREIVFDTETTGLNPVGGDRMVEIGCIEIYNRVETGRHFHAYFNPDRDMPFEAEAVHGLTAIFLSDKPRFADKAEELLAQVYVELTGGRQIGLGLITDAGTVAVQESARPVTVREPRPPRPHVAAPGELERHRAFIAKLVNPLWERFVEAG